MHSNVLRAKQLQLLPKRISKITKRFGKDESTSNKDCYFQNLLKENNENGSQINNATSNNNLIQDQNESTANHPSTSSNIANRSILTGEV